MTERMESKIIELETLTPLFIKGKDLDYGEGMLRGSDGVVYLIDNDKLCEYIASKDKIGEYIKYFSESDGADRRNFSIDDFLRQEKIFPDQAKIKELAYGITQLSQGKKFVQNGNGRPYIPGSSIKGAIRNAIIWKIISIKKEQDPSRDVLDRYKKSLNAIAFALEAKKLASDRKWSDAQKEFDKVLQTEFVERRMFAECKQGNRVNFFIDRTNTERPTLDAILSQFSQSWDKSLTDKTVIRPVSDIHKNNDRWQSTNDILRDILRIVKISDANLTGEVALEKKQLNVICKDPNNLVYQKCNYRKKQGDYQSIKLELETLSLAAKATFKVTIDREMANMFFGDLMESDYSFLYSVYDLLEVVNEFFLSVWKEEKKFFSNGAYSVSSIIDETDKQKFIDVARIHDLYNNHPILSNEKLLRTGWGGGYISKTQFLHFDDVGRANIRNIRHNRGDQLAPKSRLLIVEGGRAISPLGWCKLRVLDDDKDQSLPSIDEANIITDLLTEQSRGRQDAHQHRQGRRKNHERHVSEKEIQQLNEAANKIVKRAEKQKASASHKTYKTGEKVGAVVESCVPFQSVTVKINEQTLIIKKGIIKQKGETVTLQITKTENGEIIEAKLL